MKKTVMAFLVVGWLIFQIFANAVPPLYKNVYISYFSSANVNQLGDYFRQKQPGLQGVMEWEISSDLPVTNNKSLMSAVDSNAGFDGKTFGLYWGDWDMYLSGHEIPGTDSPVSSFKNDFSAISQQHVLRVFYAFLEGITKKDNVSDKIGWIYFDDPWSDLSPTSCVDGNLSDDYTMRERNAANPPSPTKSTCLSASKFDNFTQFKGLSNAQRLISIGGYSHDGTFEAIFPNGVINPAYENNFLTSVADIVNQNGLDGVDLDYENPSMTHAQAGAYLTLVQDLRKKLPGKKITIAVLADPLYLQGKRDGSFGFNNLFDFSSQVDAIDLMTYDFHGNFDFGPGGTNKTGFSSNITTSTAYAPKFSMDASVTEAIQLHVPLNKLVVGIPAYGRALGSISVNNGGLAEGLIPGEALQIPGGDLDNRGCSGTKNCTGMFSDHYIHQAMLLSGFSAKENYQEGGSTAYASSWAPAQGANYNLEVSNLGPKTGIIAHILDNGAELFKSNYLVPNTGDETYNINSSPSAAPIEGKSNLSVKWDSYSGGPQGVCMSTLNFNANYHVMINADTDVCTISKLP